MSDEAIWSIPKGKYQVQYSDNVILELTSKHIIFNYYCWKLFTAYPNTPITSRCCITKVLNGGIYNADTHISLLQSIFNHICDFNNLETYDQKLPLIILIEQVKNDIYNKIVHRISDYVTTIDAVDFIQVVNSPEISSIHQNLKPYPDSIDKAYKGIKSSMEVLDPNNRFVKAFRSKSINDNQSNQCIGPRGVVADLDKTVFRLPIMSGFIKGMSTLYELLTESRTAAKSLNANDTHIQTSEYASRRIQLLTMVVRSIVPGDCGSKETLDVFVTPIILECLKGKYYYKEDGTMDFIRGNEEHLLNSIVSVRTTLGCKHHDPQQICSTCAGRLSGNFKANSNLGYLTTSYLMEKLTQTILSTKHLTHSVKKAMIQLEDGANKYFYCTDDNNIYFNKDLNLTGLQMVLPNSRLSKLVDVLNTKNTNIALNKVGELDDIIIRDTKAKTVISDTVNIAYRDRTSIITKSLLDYIRSIKIESDARGNFVIPLDNYPKDQPVFHNPLKESNIISFVNRITSIIETNKDKNGTPYDKLNTLFSCVIEQFKCNLFILEIMVYATTAYNTYNQNYRLGRNSEHSKCENKGLLFRYRSAGQLMVFEEQIKHLITAAPAMFGNDDRMEHPMDVLFQAGSIVK